MNPLQSFSENLRKKPVILGAVLALGTIALFAPVAGYQFLLVDDSAYVTQNPNVNTGLSVTNVVWAFKDFSSFYWHPLAWISHMLDCQLFGLNPGPHHLVNVALHVINVLLLFLLLRMATGAVWRSFLVAALFAVHPMNVENVAWIAERKSLLSAMFTLLTIAAYGWWVKRPGLKLYGLLVIAFCLALMSKSMAVTIPVVLLLLDYWPLRRLEDIASGVEWKRLIVEKLPLLLISIVSSLITFFGQRSAGAVVSLAELPMYMRVENAITSYVIYLGKLFWPVNLTFFYPHPSSKLPQGAHLPADQLLASAAILLGISAFVLYFRHVRYLPVGWFWFLITIFPVIGIAQAGLQGMADRFAYVPYIGLFVFVVWGGEELLEALAQPRLKPVVAATSACVVLALAMASSSYLKCWKDGITLLEHARVVAGAPDARIEIFLGDAYSYAGQPGKAIPHYRTGCQLVPLSDLCHFNLAQVLFQQGELREAVMEYEAARTLTRDSNIATTSAQKSREALRMLGQ
jgi:protein O-mannosyl-transferase